jgi:hypothetical protein
MSNSEGSKEGNMLNSKDLLLDLELFEELNDRVSEKISGGASFEALWTDLKELKILDSDLQQQIDRELKKIFPKGIANTAALSCVTEDGKFKCEASSDGQKKKFILPLMK